MRLWTLLLAGLLVAGLTGCATMAGFEDWQVGAGAGGDRGVDMVSSPEYAAYRAEVDSWGWGKYFLVTWKDLGADLVDIFSLEVSYGPGILVDLQPTKLAEVGAGYGDFAKAGWRGRACGYYREERAEGGLSGVYYRSLDLIPHYGNTALAQRPRSMRDFAIRHNEDRHWADVGASAHVAFLGAGAYVSPMEAVDFGLSLLTLPYDAFLRPLGNALDFRPPEVDLANDDTLAQIREKYKLQLAEKEEGFPPAEKIDEAFRIGY